MTNQELWRLIQEAMGYTDAELAQVQQDPQRRGVLESGGLMVRRKIIGEVIAAKNCAAHPIGAKYIIRGNGAIRSKDQVNDLCIDLVAALAGEAKVIFYLIGRGEDPKGKYVSYVHCPDTGVECGGFGYAVLKVTVE